MYKSEMIILAFLESREDIFNILKKIFEYNLPLFTMDDLFIKYVFEDSV